MLAGDVTKDICYSWWESPIWWFLSTKISEALYIVVMHFLKFTKCILYCHLNLFFTL